MGIFDFPECYPTPTAHFSHFLQRLFWNFQFCYQPFMLVLCQAFRDHVNYVDLCHCFCHIGHSRNFTERLATSPPFKFVFFLGKCCDSSVQRAQHMDLLYITEGNSVCFSLSWSAFWLENSFPVGLTERVFTCFVSLLPSSTWLGPLLFLESKVLIEWSKHQSSLM